MRRLLVIPALAIAVAAGCGGSDDKGSSSVPTAANYSQSTTPVTSKKQYIAQADAACAQLNARIKSLPSAKDKKDVPRLYRQIAAEAQSFYDAFKAIPKRPQDEKILTKYQQNLAKSLSITKAVPAAFEASDKKKVAKYYAEARKLQREDRSIAKRYGFKVCGGSTAG
jgi:hypothetical protein